MTHFPLPTDSTLAKYGLSRTQYRRMFNAQGRCCQICKRKGVQFVIDHEHVRGWKRMDPNERRKYVRGILCRSCNHRIVNRYARPRLLMSAAYYLEEYERKKNGNIVRKNLVKA